MRRASNVGLVVLAVLGSVVALIGGSWWARGVAERGDAERSPAPRSDSGRPAPPAASPAATTSETPEARLAHARAAWDDRDLPKTAKWLESLMDDPGESGRVAATWLVTLRIQMRDPEGAARGLERVVKAFGGQGIDKDGRELSADLLAAGVTDDLIEVARSRVEGPSPDIAKARATLSLAERVGLSTPAAVYPYWESADHYVALAEPSDLIADGVPRPPRSLDLKDGLELPAVAGPRVIAFVDDFQLGEPILPSVLKRWAKGIPVAIVGRLAGHVRFGVRRQKVELVTEEKDAIAKRVREIGVTLGGFVLPEGVVEERFGLLSSIGAYVFVVDEDGRLVARMSGNSLDPRPLDPVVAKLVPDPSVIAPPK